MMKSCRDCVHYKPCEEWAIDCFHGNTIFPYEAETGEEICEHYTPTTDVVPKSEVDEIIGAFDTWLYKHYNGDISDWDLYKLFAKLKKKYIGEKE